MNSYSDYYDSTSKYFTFDKASYIQRAWKVDDLFIHQPPDVLFRNDNPYYSDDVLKQAYNDELELLKDLIRRESTLHFIIVTVNGSELAGVKCKNVEHGSGGYAYKGSWKFPVYVKASVDSTIAIRADVLIAEGAILLINEKGMLYFL